LNVQVDVLPAASVAVYLTCVVPIGKMLPGSWVETSVGTAQLSDAVGGVQLATAWQDPLAVSKILEGHPEIMGFVTSFTITLNVQIAVRPAASVAVYFTCVAPIGNRLPEVCVDISDGVPQLSVAVGAVHVATAWHDAFAESVMFDGHPVITGLVASLTITSKVHVEELPEPSVAVYLTCVVPIAKTLPGLCVLVKVNPEQLSEAVGALQVTFA
jgi:hypothetical protein